LGGGRRDDREYTGAVTYNILKDIRYTGAVAAWILGIYRGGGSQDILMNIPGWGIRAVVASSCSRAVVAITSSILGVIPGRQLAPPVY
jgi:hypothetical protein